MIPVGHPWRLSTSTRPIRQLQAEPTLCVLYGLRLLEMAVFERFWRGLTANCGGLLAASG